MNNEDMNQQIPKHISAVELNLWLQQESQKPLLIDVREAEEIAIATFPLPVVHFPLSQASQWVDQLPEKLSVHQPVVVICHSGIRSLNFGQWLLQQDLQYEVWNLDGGIDAWSVNVDPEIPRY